LDHKWDKIKINMAKFYTEWAHFIIGLYLVQELFTGLPLIKENIKLSLVVPHSLSDFHSIGLYPPRISLLSFTLTIVTVRDLLSQIS
jgi:hypothetical protein